MDANLKAVVSAAFRICREAGTQATLQELAYVTALLDARGIWLPGGDVIQDGDSGTAVITSPNNAGRLLGPGIDAAVAEEMGRRVAEEIGAMRPSERAVLDLQIAVAAAQEDQAKRADSRHAGREARLAALARRAASVCSSAADSGSDAVAAAGARGTTHEYERAFKAALAYVLEASRLGGSDDSAGSSSGATGPTRPQALMNGSSASSAPPKKLGNSSAAVRSGTAAAASSTAVAGRGSSPLYTEVEAALDSVFPLSSVAWWVTLPPAERLAELQALAKLTLGVITFNSAAVLSTGSVPGFSPGQHAGNGGGHIRSSSSTVLRGLTGAVGSHSGGGHTAPNHAASISSVVPAAADQLRRGGELVKMLASVEAAAWAAFDRTNRVGGGRAVHTIGSSFSWVGRASVEAVFCAQAATSLRLLRADASAALAACQAIDAAASNELSMLSRTVASGTAVPKDSVFPSFQRIGALRIALAQEFELFEALGDVFSALAASLQRAAAAGAGLPDILASAAAREEAAAALAGAEAWGQQQQLGMRGGLTAGGPADKASEPEQGAIRAAIEDASAELGLSVVPAGELAANAAFAADTFSSWQQGRIIHQDGAREAQRQVGVGIPSGRRMSDQEAQLHVSKGNDRRQEADNRVTALALNGWCAASIAASAAASTLSSQLQLGRPADPSLGAVRYKGAIYGFSTAAAAAAFVADPGAVLAGVCRATANGTLLPHLWGRAVLQADSGAAAGGSSGEPEATAASGSGGGDGSPAVSGSALGLWRVLRAVSAAPLRVEAGTQTPTHFVEERIDRDYEWNEWVLRRRIIALANLRAAATHSAQTDESAFRAEAVTQTWPPRPAGTQTDANKGSAMPRRVRYVAGLRGSPGSKMRVFGSLTWGSPINTEDNSPGSAG